MEDLRTLTDREGLSAVLDRRSRSDIRASVRALGPENVIAHVVDVLNGDAAPIGELPQTATVQWTVTTDRTDPVCFFFRVDDFRFVAQPGVLERPRVTIALDVADFLLLMAGQLDVVPRVPQSTAARDRRHHVRSNDRRLVRPVSAATPALAGIGRSLPERVVGSVEIEQLVGERSDDFRLPQGLVRLLSGVDERRYAREDETSSDLAAAAAAGALEMAGVEPADVDLVIFAGASHDVSEPATANLVQVKTRCRNAAVFDVKNACNSFLNAIDVATAVIETRRCHTVLVASGEVLSPTVRWNFGRGDDIKSQLAALTLGDAGGACLISDGGAGRIHPGCFMSDGAHWELSTIMGGGTLMRHDVSRMYFECDSSRLFEVSAKHIPAVVERALGQAGWTVDDVDLVVPHQASRSIIQLIAAEMGFPASRCEMTLDRFGNTAAASIPVALATAVAEGRVRTGDRILLVGGAAGFSAGVIAVEWGIGTGTAAA